MAQSSPRTREFGAIGNSPMRLHHWHWITYLCDVAKPPLEVLNRFTVSITGRQAGHWHACHRKSFPGHLITTFAWSRVHIHDKKCPVSATIPCTSSARTRSRSVKLSVVEIACVNIIADSLSWSLPPQYELINQYSDAQE